MKKIVVSGGFDPVHIGHLRMFQKARELGDHLNVVINSDEFLEEKKGYSFMNFEERKEIILGFSCVDEVTKCIDQDNTVCKTLEMLSKKNAIDIFANGGDRKNIEDIPEYKVCEDNNVELVFGIGGGKIQSSSELTKPFLNYTEERPWGSFENILDEKNYLVKKLIVNPMQKLSLQYHNHREEHWIVTNGKGKVVISGEEFLAEVGSRFFIEKKEIHRIENDYDEPLVLIEVQLGERISEEDIVRLDDTYGRN
jgi:D-beta-D-heptose 7-phosphate kinase/D-beta-D-heptose 1-phosphate adenosyltransferase|tara:strand:+ start:13 stop:771 length:759 start_codon:yes stop_codon:yes gene_type:complete